MKPLKYWLEEAEKYGPKSVEYIARWISEIQNPDYLVNSTDEEMHVLFEDMDGPLEQEEDLTQCAKKQPNRPVLEYLRTPLYDRKTLGGES